MNTATRLFAQKGFEGLSIREIAEEAEIAVPVLYRFFVDKRDLYVQCCRDALAKDVTAFDWATEAALSDKEVILKFTKAILERRADRNIPHIVTRAIFDGDAESLDNEFKEFFQADFFSRTVQASAALSDEESAARRLLFIYSLAFGLPKLSSLWEKHFLGDTKESNEVLGRRFLEMVYPNTDWSTDT